MSKILVPTDFSIIAKNALGVAIQIAKKSGSEIVILNALDYSAHIDSLYMGEVTPAYLTDVYGDLKKQSDEKLTALKNDYANEGVSIKSINKSGFLRDVLEEVIAKQNINLVVMGSNGSSGIEEVFIGSNAEKVVRNANCPVLVVGRDDEGIDIKNVMLTFDFEEEIGDGFNEVLDFVKTLGAKLHLVRINAPYNFWSTNLAMNRIDEFAEKWRITNYVAAQYDHERLEYGIVQYAKRNDIQIIAMGTHRRKGLQHLFQGSKTEDAVNHITMPILTFKI